MLDNMDKKKKRKLIVGVIVALFVVTLGSGAIRFGGDELDIIRPLFDYATGTYTMSVSRVSVPLESGDTVDVLVNDEVSITVQVHWDSTRNHPQQIQCKIIDSYYGIFYQDIAWDDIDNNDDYFWTFDLKDLPTGNYVYHFEFVGYYPDAETATSIYDGQSFYFNIDKTAEQIPDEPSIWDEPDDFEMVDTSSRTLIWEYQYGSSGTITLSMDGDVEDTTTFTGRSSSQFYRYTFNPESQAIGDYVFKFSLDPDYTGHSTLESSVTVTVITHSVIDGIPSDLDGVAIRLDGQLSTIGWDISHQWIEDKDAVPSDVYGLPKTGNLRVVVVGELGDSYSITAFTGVRMILRNPTISDISLDLVLETEITSPFGVFMFGFTLTTWYEVNVDLDSLEAGEYECEILCEHGGAWYRVSEFTLAVNVFPVGWLIGNIGLIVLVMVSSVVVVKVLREGKGWWGFQGKYGRE